MSIAAAIKKPRVMNSISFHSFSPFFAFRLLATLFFTALFKGWYFSGLG